MLLYSLMVSFEEVFKQVPEVQKSAAARLQSLAIGPVPLYSISLSPLYRSIYLSVYLYIYK